MSKKGSATETKANMNSPKSPMSWLVRVVALVSVNIFAIWFIRGLILNEVWHFALAFIVVAVFLNLVFIRESLYPLRWMSIGLSLMILLAIYPILFTVYIAFTNYGDGHLLTKERALIQLQREKYLPEGGISYSWTGFQAEDGTFALWLQAEGEPGLLAKVGEPIRPVSPGTEGVGELNEDGVPVTIEGYKRVNRLELVQFLETLTTMQFGVDPDIVQVKNLDSVAKFVPKYEYDPVQDSLTDLEKGIVYRPIDGTFTAEDGSKLATGWREVIGFRNFTDFFASPALQGPLLRIISWNFAFALLSVLTTFALGLFVALMFNEPNFPAKKLIRSFLLVPYTIPSLITILIWRGLLNPQLGVINNFLNNSFGVAPPWFTDPIWAKVGILLINLWLGYPYFMLVCSGALQAIPSDIYEAARVDGANRWQQFWRLTLPLLLVAVGPLLIASFTFNFNNFNVIYLFNSGGPPIAGTSTPAGHTDILISYVYRLAFAGGRGADYGLASAITIVIFFIVAGLTLFQFRYTKMWEEVGENA